MTAEDVAIAAAALWAQLVVSGAMAVQEHYRWLNAPAAWSMWPLFIAAVVMTAKASLA